MVPGVYTVRDRAEPLLTRFGLAVIADKAVERRAKTFRWLTFLLGVPGLVGLSVFPATPWLALPLAGLVAGIVCAFRWRHYHTLDLDDRKLQAVLKLLRVLRADVPHREPLDLTVDLRDYRHGGRLLLREGSWFGSNVKKYGHAWLRLGARLADGNRITVLLSDRVIRRQKRKSAGGKTKYKVVERCWSEVTVSLRLDKHYRPVERLVGRLRSRSAPVLLAVRSVSASPEGARVDASLRTPVFTTPAALADGDVVLSAIRWLYGGLAEARRSA